MDKVKCFLVEVINLGETNEAWRRVDTGEVSTYPTKFGPGAMWYEHEYLARLQPEDEHNETWRKHWHAGPDGKVLLVVCPNGRVWNIDSRAGNCGKPDDNTHACWVRHGVPPEITVDKDGDTCTAGAGSIQAGDYHGFLRNGFFETC